MNGVPRPPIGVPRVSHWCAFGSNASDAPNGAPVVLRGFPQVCSSEVPLSRQWLQCAQWPHPTPQWCSCGAPQRFPPMVIEWRFKAPPPPPHTHTHGAPRVCCTCDPMAPMLPMVPPQWCPNGVPMVSQCTPSGGPMVSTGAPMAAMRPLVLPPPQWCFNGPHNGVPMVFQCPPPLPPPPKGVPNGSVG